MYCRRCVAVDAAGNLYIADNGNNRIQKVSAATGVISTIAGSVTGAWGLSGNGGAATSALLDSPNAVAVDAAGDVFIGDSLNNEVREIPAASANGMTAGDIYDIAGSATGAWGLSGNGGAATSALLNGPNGLAVDAAGDLYIADTNNDRIQEVARSAHAQWGQAMTKGDIYTVAGSASGTAGNAGDGGPASAATLESPRGVTVDASGDLYIADTYNNRAREVAAANGTQWGQQMSAGDIYNVAGGGAGTLGNSGDGGPAMGALLDHPASIGTDPAGDLFIADFRVHEVTATSAGMFPGYPAPGGVTITQPQGAQVTFYPQANGTCTAPYQPAGAGGYCVLPQDINATLTYSSASQTYTYSPSPGLSYTYGWNGVLTAETDAGGNTLTITYQTPAPGTGQCPSTATSCTTITAASGRALVIALNASGLVTSVTDPLGRTWTYGYTGSDLTSATDPMGNKTTYTYGAASTGNSALANDLLSITSPDAQPGGPDAGVSTINTYNTAGQVTTQTDPMGFKTTFDYTGMNTATGNGIVRVNDPDGNTTVYDYTQGALAAQSDWTGTTLTSEQDNGPDLTTAGTSGGTLLDSWTADGNGNITSYTYDASGNATSTTAPDGIGSQTGTATAQYTALNSQNCAGTAEASIPCSASRAGPSPVAPGGVITPPSAAPPAGETWTLYDTHGSELYATTGVYQPGSSSAPYLRTTYQLFNGNSVTLSGTNITCTSTSPSPSLPCATINADGVVTQLHYDAQGDLTSSSTPDGNGSEVATTTYAYNADGEQASTTSPDGNLSGASAGDYTTTTAYNGDGQKTSVTQAGGSGATVTPRTTSYGYDANGNQATEQDARGYTTTTAYNADDKATLVTDPEGNATLTCYDGDGHMAQTVPPVGVAANGLTQASCPRSYPPGYTDRLAADATTSTYDADGNQTATTSPAPAGQSGYETTTYTYDGNGNLSRTIAPATSNSGGAPTQVTLNSYNAANKLSAVTSGYGTSAASTTTYCYDPNGDTSAVVAPDGNTSGPASCDTSSPWAVSSSAYPVQAAYQTTSSYDSVGELVSTTSPATAAAPSAATTTDTYDPAGNMLTSTDPDGTVTTWTYTPGNRKASVSYSASSAHSITFTYDANGQQTGMTDATGFSNQSYDPFGELTSATNGAGQTIGYGYNADGKITAITYPLPNTAIWPTTDTMTYGYDHADRLTSFTDFNGNQVSITNSADSQPSSETLGSTGDTIAISYGQTHIPSVISLKNSSATLQSFGYSDAPSGDILTETDTPSSPISPTAYAYDAAGRVTSMTPGTGSALNYSFDASSNLTSLPLGATATYDNAGELTSAALAGVTTNYTYNADGERLTAKNGSTTVASGTWNGAQQLTAYSDGAADMSSATYDGSGLRGSATITPSGGSAITQNFAWNTTTPVPELLMDSANAYLYGPSGTPAEQVNLSTGGITYLVQDSLGSVRGIVSSSGALTASTAYDAWGNPGKAGGLTSYTPFGYAGGYTDSTGLLYLVNRYYDPAAGQFLSVDPWVSSTHQPYSYGGGNPVSNTDPHGTSACSTTVYGGWWKWVPGGIFGGCVFGQGLYVWGMSAGFVGWKPVCGWHYYWTAYWWGQLRHSWWAPYHGGCTWNNNGNYNYRWPTAYWYAHPGPFDAQLWATDPFGRQYRLALVSEWVW